MNLSIHSNTHTHTLSFIHKQLNNSFFGLAIYYENIKPLKEILIKKKNEKKLFKQWIIHPPNRWLLNMFPLDILCRDEKYLNKNTHKKSQKP